MKYKVYCKKCKEIQIVVVRSKNFINSERKCKECGLMFTLTKENILGKIR